MHKIASIAESVGITAALATRIVVRLKGVGHIVSTLEGRQKHYTLGTPAAEINIYDVVFAMEGEPCTTHHCPKIGDGCEASEHCKTHSFLKTLQSNMVEDMLGTSIADLV